MESCEMVNRVEDENGVVVDSHPAHRAPRVLDATDWSFRSYVVHNEAMREADARFAEERDRRYKEVNIEKEKALKIKETADLAALGLAREIQDYKEHQNNGKSAQLADERNTFAPRDSVTALSDKFDAAHAPVLTYIASQQGRSGGFNAGWGFVVSAVVAVTAIVTIALMMMK